MFFVFKNQHSLDINQLITIFKFLQMRKIKEPVSDFLRFINNSVSPHSFHRIYRASNDPLKTPKMN
jgi:hypothetical protein